VQPLNRWAAFCWIACLLNLTPAQADPEIPLPPDPKAFEAKLAEDLGVIQAYRNKLSTIADYVLMDGVPPEGLKKEHYRANLRETWVSFLDYLIAMDSIGRSYAPFFQAPEKALAKEAFDSGYWIFLAEYRYAAQFVRNLEGVPNIEPLLNEPIPELGLPQGTYSAFKALAQGKGKTAELFGKDKIYFSYGVGDRTGLRFSQTREDKNAILRFCSPLQLKELKKTGEENPGPNDFTPWIPNFKGLPRWTGKSNPWRWGKSALSTGQVEFLLNHLEPGDILLSRREWYFSGVGRPGYWSQASLYLGDEASRKAYFEDPAVQTWLAGRGQKGTYEEYLKKEFHEKYPACLKLDGRGRPLRLVEASPEGIRFESLERFSEADSICVLRPRLTKPAIANAVLRAFRCLGKPFDFNFDDESDGQMTGTEMLAFCFKPDGKIPGLRFLQGEMLGNYFTSPNTLVEQFDGDFGTPGQQLDLVVFLEREKKNGLAEFNGLGEFRQSWKRPKWNNPPSQP